MIAFTIKTQAINDEQKQFDCKVNKMLSAFATKGSNRVNFFNLIRLTCSIADEVRVGTRRNHIIGLRFVVYLNDVLGLHKNVTTEGCI